MTRGWLKTDSFLCALRINTFTTLLLKSELLITTSIDQWLEHLLHKLPFALLTCYLVPLHFNSTIYLPIPYRPYHDCGKYTKPSFLFVQRTPSGREIHSGRKILSWSEWTVDPMQFLWFSWSTSKSSHWICPSWWIRSVVAKSVASGRIEISCGHNHNGF